MKSACLTLTSRRTCQWNLIEQLTISPKREGKFWEVSTFPDMFLGKGLWTGQTKMCVPIFNLPYADVYVSLVVVVRCLKRLGLQMPCKIPNNCLGGDVGSGMSD